MIEHALSMMWVIDITVTGEFGSETIDEVRSVRHFVRTRPNLTEERYRRIEIDAVNVSVR
ncbi:hypothetical protein AMR74_13360 [Halorubrum tropicale]|uniref:Uncharacterized protein n=1 Tax=Halorubrum tropicale TaxID=1765655 RepID=A0A0N0UAB2_9EURY|nr:hypothetical protein AMR74_13360 [Halorubrum tropicale]